MNGADNIRRAIADLLNDEAGRHGNRVDEKLEDAIDELIDRLEWLEARERLYGPALAMLRQIRQVLHPTEGVQGD